MATLGWSVRTINSLLGSLALHHLVVAIQLSKTASFSSPCRARILFPHNHVFCRRPWVQYAVCHSLWSQGLTVSCSRLNRPFRPPKSTLKDIHDAVPKHLLRRTLIKAIIVVYWILLLQPTPFGQRFMFWEISPLLPSSSRLCLPLPPWRVSITMGS